MNLFDLIIILLFVVAPILSAIFRRRQSPPQAQRQGSPGEPQEPTSPAPTAPSQASVRRSSRQTADAQRDNSAEGAFDQRLEQARQRVREAMSQEGGEVMGEAPPSSSQSSPRPEDPDAARRRMAAEASRSRTEAARLQQRSRRRLGIEGAAEVEKPASQPVARARLGGTKTARLQRGLLSFDAESLQHGIIWHEILSKPLAKRKPGRQPFRLR
jgi:hypothetical protein